MSVGVGVYLLCVCDLNVQSAGEAKEELLKNKEKAQEAELGITPYLPIRLPPPTSPLLPVPSFQSTLASPSFCGHVG
jgi:hypothetical protein